MNMHFLFLKVLKYRNLISGLLQGQFQAVIAKNCFIIRGRSMENALKD